MDSAGFDLKRDPPAFTNEVQHLKQVVPCRDTVSYRSRHAARLPVFMKTGNRSGKSLQLWIASRRRSHESRRLTPVPRSVISPPIRKPGPMAGAGPAPGWTANKLYASLHTNGSPRLTRPLWHGGLWTS